ncbi:hypothetical protein BKA62DRAFT_173777 [Auriculariales sp. MPI-PUGE-AT-0066]|nr:hypothetical protein BKA62DRAFT_173777 [Auriculariales sp. MPI-PUGE-AT-0066]
MLPGGLLPALEARHDWSSIQQILSQAKVQDIPELHLLALLKNKIDYVKLHPERGNVQHNAHAESQTGYPNRGKRHFLSHTLDLVMAYPTTAPALRAAIRAHLRTAEDVGILLPLLAMKLTLWTGVADLQRLSVQDAKAESKAEIATTQNAKKFQETLVFIQTLLDATFLSLVQEPAFHPALEKLQAIVQPQLELNERMEMLRGPLERFSRHVKAEEERAKKAEREPAGKFVPGWRKKAQTPGDQVVAIYQVERFVLM